MTVKVEPGKEYFHYSNLVAEVVAYFLLIVSVQSIRFQDKQALSTWKINIFI